MTSVILILKTRINLTKISIQSWEKWDTELVNEYYHQSERKKNNEDEDGLVHFATVWFRLKNFFQLYLFKSSVDQ
jgi:hypothetical protein